MGSVDKKILIWFPVDNNSCSSCISHEITLMWSIVKLLSCNTSLYYVESRTPYFNVFALRSCSMSEEVRNITTQSILSLAGDPYSILIGKAQKLFLVILVQQKRYCYIIKCLIRNFNFNIYRRCISTCILRYDVHVVTCLHKFRISFQ